MFKIHEDKGDHFEFESHINEFLIPREMTKSSETFLVIVKPGKSSHMHKHPEQEQTFYITKGEGEIWTRENPESPEEKFCSVKAGDLVFVPIDDWHQIKTVGEVDLEYVCFNAFPEGFPEGEGTSMSHAVNVRKMQLKNEK